MNIYIYIYIYIYSSASKWMFKSWWNPGDPTNLCIAFINMPWISPIYNLKILTGVRGVFYHDLIFFFKTVNILYNESSLAPEYFSRLYNNLFVIYKSCLPSSWRISSVLFKGCWSWVNKEAKHFPDQYCIIWLYLQKTIRDH